MPQFTHSLKSGLSFYGFESVNLITGAVIYKGIDFCISGIVPLEWKRIWYSDSSYIGMLGHGVHTLFDSHLITFEEENCIGLVLEDGRVCGFEFLYNDEEYYSREERLTLRRSNEEFRLFDHNKKLYYIYKSVFGAKNNYYHLVKIENETGLSIKLDIINNRLQKITDTAGRTVCADSDMNGRITSLSLVTDKGAEPLVSYTYDEDGNMTSIIDALGQITHIRYTTHLMTEKTDRNGDTYYWEYDGKGRCVHTYGRDGMMEGRIEYHPEKGYNLVTDSTGGTTTYRYTPEQLITAEIDPLGNETRHSYTDYMEPYRTTDPEGGVTGYSYDGEGKLTGITYPDGSGEMFVHDERGRLIIHIDREGNKTVRLYDRERPHLVTGFIDAAGEVTELAYDAHGLPVAVSKGKRRSELSYDSEMNLEAWHENGRKLGGWKHDARGRMTERTSPGYRTEYYHYDALDRLRRIDARDGNVIHLDYDSYDSITEARDARRHVRMGYNSVGSMTWREEAGHRVSFSYDGMDRLIEVVNEAGAGYLFGRDLAGNITSERDYGGIGRTYHRDGCGRVTRIDRPGGRSTTYTYDAMGRVTTAAYHDGTREEYGYDRNGLMVSADNTEARIRLERDPMGRVVCEKAGLPGGDTFTQVMSVESEYSIYGERTRVRSSLGADMRLSYDRPGLVGGIKAEVERPEPDRASAEEGNTGKKNIQSWESSILRDDAGRETERFATGGIKITTDYDDMGLVRSRHVHSGERHTGWRSYRWDVGARLMSMRCNLSPEPVIFDYDGMCNLVRADYSMHESIFRTPDKVGNLYRSENRRDRTYDGGGRLTSDGEFHYRYDCEGNLVHRSRRNLSDMNSGSAGRIRKGLFGLFSSPENGEGGNAGSKDTPFADWQPGDTCYEWLASGMLAGVKTPDGKTVSFGYDALGRRVSKTVDGTVRRFGWDGNVVLHEWEISEADRPKLITDGSGREEYEDTEKPENLVTWIYDGTSFTPVAKVAGRERYTIVHDYLGTPTQAYDSRGNLVWEMLLNVYGEVKECHGDRTLVPFRYQGQYEDIETGLYYNRFRYYSPQMGMYISSDPIGLAGNNPTLYGYVLDVNTWLDVWGWENIWFRALRVEDIIDLKNNNGINAKNPSAQMPVITHINHGSDDWYSGQYISITKDRSIAEKWAINSSTEVAEIDLDKLESAFINLSTPEGREQWIMSDSKFSYNEKIKANKYASMMEEGLVECKINQSAIKKIYKPSCN